MKLLQLHPKKKKGVKNAATTELGDENRIWTADEIGCLLNIMVTMLEEFSCITKLKKKICENRQPASPNGENL